MTRFILCAFLLTTFGCSSKFDKELWLKNQNSNPDNPRFDMMDDLERNYIKKGMDRFEIVKLLGTPAYDTVDRPMEYTYEIGSNPGFHMDSYFLVIKFDSTGRLVSFATEGHCLGKKGYRKSAQHLTKAKCNCGVTCCHLSAIN